MSVTLIILWCIGCNVSDYDDVKSVEANQLPFNSVQQCEDWFIEASNKWLRNRCIVLQHRCVKKGID